METRTLVAILVTLVLYVIVIGQAVADDWRTEDTRREIAYNVLAGVDMMQTMDIRNEMMQTLIEWVKVYSSISLSGASAKIGFDSRVPFRTDGGRVGSP